MSSIWVPNQRLYMPINSPFIFVIGLDWFQFCGLALGAFSVGTNLRILWTDLWAIQANGNVMEWNAKARTRKEEWRPRIQQQIIIQYIYGFGFGFRSAFARSLSLVCEIWLNCRALFRVNQSLFELTISIPCSMSLFSLSLSLVCLVCLFWALQKPFCSACVCVCAQQKYTIYRNIFWR